MVKFFSQIIAIYFFILITACTNSKDVKTKVMPILTTSGPVHICSQNEERIVLIKRAKAPFGYAMFGGHVDEKESPQHAFIREMQEELSIDDPKNIKLVGVYGDYGRDPRQHSVEVTYSAISFEKPKAASDAKEVVLLTPQNILRMIAKDRTQFAFDHAMILENYLRDKNNLKRCIK